MANTRPEQRFNGKKEFLKFLEEKVIFTGISTQLILREDLVREYKKYCDGQGISPASVVNIGRLMSKLGAKCNVRVGGSHGVGQKKRKSDMENVKQPKRVKTSAEKKEDFSSFFEKFLSPSSDSNDIVGRHDLFQEYNTYCQQNGLQEIHKFHIGRLMATRGLEFTTREGPENKRLYYYKCLKWTDSGMCKDIPKPPRPCKTLHHHVKLDQISPVLIEVEPDLFEVEPDLMEVEPDLVEVEPDLVKAEPDQHTPNVAKVESDQVEVEPNQAEVEPDRAEVEPDQAEVEPDHAEVELDQAEVEPDQAEVEPDQHTTKVAKVEPDQHTTNVAKVEPGQEEVEPNQDLYDLSHFIADLAVISPDQHTSNVAVISPDQHTPNVAMISPDQHTPNVAMISPDQHTPNVAMISPDQHTPNVAMISPDQHTPNVAKVEPDQHTHPKADILILARQAGFHELDSEDIEQVLASHTEELTNEELQRLTEQCALKKKTMKKHLNER
ncbi:Salivary glue protein Sgs-4-like 4 [Homarus americanus]|uniref:Salivary glue protein Sgs-4-like 4 n=1 Tax=Homarus americanus TaxID=6706 RepID=A0A8J5JJW6_HOMAM|nr:Salivary glue protein Sgs-4-like 4 [Homarus americanus]